MMILRDGCLDTGCGLKIFNKKIFLSFNFFDGIHRFLPALFKGYGHHTFFIPVNHRPRMKGISKYGTLKRLIYGLKDIMYVKKVINSYKK
jgi:dolichol-phosphate mannosyltransferase